MCVFAEQKFDTKRNKKKRNAKHHPQSPKIRKMSKRTGRARTGIRRMCFRIRQRHRHGGRGWHCVGVQPLHCDGRHRTGHPPHEADRRDQITCLQPVHGKNRIPKVSATSFLHLYLIFLFHFFPLTKKKSEQTNKPSCCLPRDDCRPRALRRAVHGRGQRVTKQGGLRSPLVSNEEIYK